MKSSAALHGATPGRHGLFASWSFGRLVALLIGLAALGAPPVQAQSSQARFSGEPVTLNFVNAEIDGVARAMGAILKQQFLVDPRVKGTITLYSEQPLTPREAYFNFLAALRGLGYTVVEVGGLFKIVPEADAKLQTGTVSIGEGVSRKGDQVITQIFKLNYENANNLVPVLRPLISPNNTINANPSNNTLVITDYADNLQRLSKIVAAMDTPTTGDVEVIPLQHAVASDIAALVQRLNETAPTPGAPPGAAAGTGAAPSILVDTRSNSLIVRSPNAARMASLRLLIAKLDQPLAGAGARGNIWVIHLKNAEATRLATVLRAAFSAGSSSAAGGGGAARGLSGTTPTGFSGGSNATGAMGALGTAGAEGTSAAATAPLNPAGAPSTGGFIQADPATNSLIVTAPEPLYRQVRAMVEQLDSRRAQVYIESMIVEVSGDNAADFGFQWQGLIGGKGSTNSVAIGTNSSIGGPSIIDLTQTIAGQGTTMPGAGLNIGLIHKWGSFYGLAAIARFLQSQANTNIVSTPNLITLDNEEAKIIVGSNVPFITGQFTTNSGGSAITNPFQTIERKDVGITLRIKPQIGENGTVRMQIFQESSSLSDKVAPGTTNAGPSTNKRSIESQVVVDDGQIIVLGGLIEDIYSDNQSKVPLLGDLPGVGPLFRSESRSKTRTNLMVFLRPVIMRDADAANRVSLERYDLMRSLGKEAQPAPSGVLPINKAPVPPPFPRVENSQTPLIPPSDAPPATVPVVPATAPPAPRSPFDSGDPGQPIAP